MSGIVYAQALAEETAKGLTDEGKREGVAALSWHYDSRHSVFHQPVVAMAISLGGL